MSFHRFYDLNSTMSQKQAVLSGHFMKLTTEIRNAAWHVVSTGKFSASFDATDNGWNLSDLALQEDSAMKQEYRHIKLPFIDGDYGRSERKSTRLKSSH